MSSFIETLLRGTFSNIQLLFQHTYPFHQSLRYIFICKLPRSVAMSNSSVTQSDHTVTCPGSGVTIFLVTVVFVCGIIGNATVIAFFRSERRLKKSPNLALLFHMSLNNVLALTTSLLLYLLLDELVPRDLLPTRLANVLCVLRPVSQFIYLKVGLFTLTGICVDRYEIFTRIAKPKFLTKRKAKTFAIASWIVAVVSSLLASYGFIQNALRQNVYCEKSPRFQKGLVTKHQTISEVWVMADLAIWITGCNAIDIFTLWSVGNVLRKHIESVKSNLGAQDTLREVKIVKMAVYVFVAYIVFWTPYGIGRGLVASLKNTKGATDCFYTFAQILSYAIFAVIPFIYIGTNKRLMKETVGKFRRPGRPAARIPYNSDRLVSLQPLRSKSDERESTSNTGETRFSSQNEN